MGVYKERRCCWMFQCGEGDIFAWYQQKSEEIIVCPGTGVTDKTVVTDKKSMWMLRIKTRSCGRTTGALNLWAISPISSLILLRGGSWACHGTLVEARGQLAGVLSFNCVGSGDQLSRLGSQVPLPAQPSHPSVNHYWEDVSQWPETPCISRLQTRSHLPASTSKVRGRATGVGHQGPINEIFLVTIFEITCVPQGWKTRFVKSIHSRDRTVA